MAKRFAVLFGFNKADESKVGYLKIANDGSSRYGEAYDVVDDEDDATKFWKSNYSRSKCFTKPEDVLKFIDDEEELQDWKFHLVWKIQD